MPERPYGSIVHFAPYNRNDVASIVAHRCRDRKLLNAMAAFKDDFRDAFRLGDNGVDDYAVLVGPVPAGLNA